MHLTLICQECINANYAADTTQTLCQHHMHIHIGTLKAMSFSTLYPTYIAWNSSSILFNKHSHNLDARKPCQSWNTKGNWKQVKTYTTVTLTLRLISQWYTIVKVITVYYWKPTDCDLVTVTTDDNDTDTQVYWILILTSHYLQLHLSVCPPCLGMTVHSAGVHSHTVIQLVVRSGSA